MHVLQVLALPPLHWSAAQHLLNSVAQLGGSQARYYVASANVFTVSMQHTTACRHSELLRHSELVLLSSSTSDTLGQHWDNRHRSQNGAREMHDSMQCGFVVRRAFRR